MLDIDDKSRQGEEEEYVCVCDDDETTVAPMLWINILKPTPKISLFLHFTTFSNSSNNTWVVKMGEVCMYHPNMGIIV